MHVSRRDLDRTVRALSEPPYIIYYRIMETRNAVEVMSIRHGARRQPKRF